VAGTAGTVVAPGPGAERRFLPALRLRPPAARPQTDQPGPVPGGGWPGHRAGRGPRPVLTRAGGRVAYGRGNHARLAGALGSRGIWVRPRRRAGC